MPRFEVAKLQVPDASRDPNTIGSKARKNPDNEPGEG